MSQHCCAAANETPKPLADSRYRRVLWIALAVNIGMFAVELTAGLRADSVSLVADAADFFGDAANYAISLLLLPLGLLWRARAAVVKGVTMAGYGVFVLVITGHNALTSVVPQPAIMGVVGFVALCANLGVAALLFRYRNGDADMRSVWLCTRNDVAGNVAVMLSALATWGTSAGWPDYLVGAVMGTLSLTAAASVLRQAGRDLNAHAPTGSQPLPADTAKP